ncbi:hypothetical protein GQ457_04G003990 [Hibiscus cannabinus]
MHSRPAQNLNTFKGKEILSYSSEAIKEPIMESEEIEDISISKMAEKGPIEIDDSKDLVDPFSLPNLSKFSFDPKSVKNEYSAIFSKGDTDMILKCSVANLNLENFKISDPQIC